RDVLCVGAGHRDQPAGVEHDEGLRGERREEGDGERGEEAHRDGGEKTRVRAGRARAVEAGAAHGVASSPPTRTSSGTVVGSNGSPLQTTTSASLPGARLPSRSATPRIVAGAIVIARSAVSGPSPKRTANIASCTSERLPRLVPVWIANGTPACASSAAVCQRGRAPSPAPPPVTCSALGAPSRQVAFAAVSASMQR